MSAGRQGPDGSVAMSQRAFSRRAPAPTAPSSARVFYKAVALQHDVRDGRRYLSYWSIFDGTTEYKLGEITTARRGVWVSADLLQCVRHSKRLPRRSARYAQPRVLLQCYGWNADGSTPLPHLDAEKLNVSHILPLAVLPYTAAAQPNAPAALHEFYAGPIATLASPELVSAAMAGLRPEARPRTAPAAPRPRELTMSGGIALRVYGGDGSARLQAQTAAMHEDVLQAEARLNQLQSIRLDAMPDQLSEWQRRALARGPSEGSAPAPLAPWVVPEGLPLSPES